MTKKIIYDNIFLKGEIATAPLNSKNMEPRWQEKRQFPRISVKAPMRCQIRGNPEFNNTISENLGVGGIGFTNERFLASNTYVNIEFNLLSHIINAMGRVTRASQLPHTSRYRVGVEFIEIEPAQKRFLSDYLDMQTGRL